MPKLTMHPHELQELRADVAAIGLRDVQLGRLLDKFVLHLAHAHDLDPAQGDARAQGAGQEVATAKPGGDEEDEPVAPPIKGRGNKHGN